MTLLLLFRRNATSGGGGGGSPFPAPTDLETTASWVNKLREMRLSPDMTKPLTRRRIKPRI